MSLKKSKLIGGARALERRRKRDEAEARAADRRAATANFESQAAQAERIHRAIETALRIVSIPDWKTTLVGSQSAERRKDTANTYRLIADDCDIAGRIALSQTVRFIASEIELGVGLGPYVNPQ